MNIFGDNQPCCPAKLAPIGHSKRREYSYLKIEVFFAKDSTTACPKTGKIFYAFQSMAEKNLQLQKYPKNFIETDTLSSAVYLN